MSAALPANPSSGFPPIQCANQFNILSTAELEDEEKSGTMTKKHTVPIKSQNYKRVQTITDTKYNRNSSKLIILADSHGKFLGHLIQQRTVGNVCSFIRPGAKFDQVVEEVTGHTSKLDKNDNLLVIAGTNNIERCSEKNLIGSICKLIEDTQHTNLSLATIPMRHDCPELDLKISRVNSEVENIAKNHPELNLLPLHMYPRHYFTSHGLHMNKRGKIKTAEMVHEHSRKTFLNHLLS